MPAAYTTPMRVAPTSMPAPAAAKPAPHHFTFREFLSELNPLQYIPVVGGIYRAVTGDTIPETARTVGSFVVSAITGGPIGIATNAAALAIEKAIGIDPEKLEQTMLAGVGIGHTHAPAPAPHTESAAAPPAAAPAPAAWSPAQLLAYGVTTTPQGALKRGDATGSDVLNDLELARHEPRPASHAYAVNTNSTPG